MDVIDGAWIKARLAGRPRGAQAALARHMGVAGHQVTKILNGTRQVKNTEVPKVLSFFDAAADPPKVLTPVEEEIAQLVSQLPDDLRLLLLTYGQGLSDGQDRPQQEPPEGDE